VFPDPKPISTVFLDTQVFVKASFNFNTAAFQALLKHFRSGRLRLLMTDVTLSEVKNNIAAEVQKEIALHAGFIKKARLLKSASLPEAVASVTPIDPDAVIQNLSSAFETFTQAGRAMRADVASVDDAGPIFEKYFAGAPPFSDGANKKFEFPDAFVLEALGRWAEDREEFVFVVSGDELFRQGCKVTGLVPMSDPVELLDYLANEEQKRAEFVRGRVKDNLAKISDLAKEGFEDNFFWVEDEEGEATVVVNELALVEGPEIISIDVDFGTLQLVFEADYTAHLDYRDSATSVRDKETGGFLYAEDREEDVERKVKLTVEVEVSFDEDDPDEVSIGSVNIVSPSGGFGIETSRALDCHYK
jgi:predicted nucleic acid-binding protein